MQISADEKLTHCRFELHSRPVLRGVPGDDKKENGEKSIIIIWPNIWRDSCPAAQLKGDTNVVQMLFNTGSNRVTDKKREADTSLKPYVQKTEDVLTSNLLVD